VAAIGLPASRPSGRCDRPASRIRAGGSRNRRPPDRPELVSAGTRRRRSL